MKAKFCRKCGTVYPKSEFSKDRGRKDGLQAYCKKCIKTFPSQQFHLKNARTKKWISENRDRYNKYHREWQRKKRAQVNAAYLCTSDESLNVLHKSDHL